MRKQARSIVITGPESTGKSSLSAGLARRYQTVWVPEYAREYLMGLTRPYREEDLLRIAREQWRRQRLARWAGRDLVFFDTGFLVLKVWSEVAYGRCHPWIEEMLDRHPPDLFLLCDVDLPWAYDPLREHPDRREELFDLYRQALEARGVPFHRVHGAAPGERLQQAVLALRALPTAG